MSEPLTLLQFQSPWQGRRGFARHSLDPATGMLSDARKAKTKKLLRKGQKNIDGLVLFPTWPTRNGLMVTPGNECLRLRPIHKGHVDMDAAPIATSDPDFQTQISERLLYRAFTFANAETELHYSDLSARLVSSQRTAYEVFPTPDFSPFARLIGIISHADAQAKLIADLKAGRFDYPCWSRAGTAARFVAPRPLES